MSKSPRISFEFFPPQGLDASFRLWETVQALAPMQPEFVSVTYGAGGTTRKLTHEAVGTIHRHYGLNVAAHLTCVDASKAETMEIVDAYYEAGVREIVALRGDAPKGASHWEKHPEGFASSVELVGAIAKTGKFKVRVGAYPERHPDSASTAADVEFLKRKIDAGATSAITQFFFEADTFFRFRDACVKAGIEAAIIPGILPITSWEGTKKFAARCGTQVPARLDEAFTRALRDGRQELFALAQCTQLCDRLIEGGVEDLHFYTLNRPDLTREVVRALGVQTQPVLENVA
ncbi:methylenetetrahydrofolate reductase [NAD(P)H] [Xinfangfangia sp. D13-10-4-6]|uniref:methylenetetrahydrofolate reductase [NAD(P)H] n=1 Tax=Pseudogemmobacter hezensis TaxID=2737662 RepID=UPI0015546FD4|nr:methylenetetrahydrofolate reductase [NAD(P)H] [Pseudogemmobacter hezensis]NPD13610.1 methylenetetrahydrofolate reductase [NAD(P)H] [Pseudogemmobacter hezensis]